MNIDKQQNDVNNLNHLMDIASHYGLMHPSAAAIGALTQTQIPHNLYSYYNTQLTNATVVQNTPQSSANIYLNTAPTPPTPQQQYVNQNQSSTPNGLHHIDDHIGNFDSCINELNNAESLIRQTQQYNTQVATQMHLNENFNLENSQQQIQQQQQQQQQQQMKMKKPDNNGAINKMQQQNGTNSSNKKSSTQMNKKNLLNSSDTQPSTPQQMHKTPSPLTSTSSPSAKRRKKDPLAPKAPLNGYLVYFNEERVAMRQKHPTMSFGELTKIIAIQWKELQPSEKQKYINEAEADKERYIKEMESYKQSDAYKHFMKETNAAKHQKGQPQQPPHQTNQQTHDMNSYNSTQNQYNNNWSSQHHNIHNINDGSNNNNNNNNGQAISHNTTRYEVPIYTDEFMEHNKMREQEMRHLRKELNEYEQQNSVLTKHIENMKQTIQKIEKECEHYKITNEHYDKKLQIFRHTMLNCFSNLPLPNTNEYPNEANIDEYIYKLYTLLTQQQQQQHRVTTSPQSTDDSNHQQQTNEQNTTTNSSVASSGSSSNNSTPNTNHQFIDNMKNVLSKFDFNSYIDC